jgi:methylglutaconyl-CoA hydratase
VLARIGLARARQLVLAGSRVGARAAMAYGLVSEVCPDAELDARVGAVVGEVLQCAPGALRACKRLLFHVAANDETLDYRADLLDTLRAGEEARQGMLAFLARRPAPWVSEA